MSAIRRLYRMLLRDQARRIAAIILIASVVAAVPYGFSMLGKWLVDDVLQVSGPPKVAATQQAGNAAPAWQPKSQSQKLRLLAVFFAITMAVHVAATGLGAWSELIKSRMTHQLIFRLRRRVHDKIATMDMAAFSRESVGQLMTRVLDDAANIPGSLVQFVVSLCTQVLMLLLGLYLLVRLNPRMALAVVATLPFYAVAAAIFLPRIKRNTEDLRDYVAGLNGWIIERLSHIATIKGYAQEERETATFHGRIDGLLGRSRRQYILNLYFGTISTVITGLGTLSVLILGFLSLRAGRMQLGEVLAFYQVTAQLFLPVSALVGLAPVMQTVQVFARRVFSILDTPLKVADATDSVALETVRGEIDFDAVSMRYQEGGPFAVDEATLHIPAGATVCFVGPTGCGKSTLLSLLVRLWDPTSGAIRLDGCDIRRVAVRDLRAAVADVIADSRVFSGTVAENIAFGAPDAPRERVEEVARIVGLDAWARSLDKGYDTPLSGDADLTDEQSARLGLARALIADPAVITIDDAYSRVPEEFEHALRQSFDEATRDRTVLIATSRLSVCEDADMVVVMQQGKIVETGTHDELLTRHGVYRRLYLRQMGRDESPDQKS